MFDTKTEREVMFYNLPNQDKWPEYKVSITRSGGFHALKLLGPDLEHYLVLPGTIPIQSLVLCAEQNEDKILEAIELHKQFRKVTNSIML